jgi:hypothetical protein
MLGRIIASFIRTRREYVVALVLIPTCGCPAFDHDLKANFPQVIVRLNLLWVHVIHIALISV